MTVYLTKSMLGRLNKVEYSNASFKYEPQAEDDHWQKLSLDSNIAYRLSNDMICRICAKGGCTPLTYKIYDNDIMGAIRSITNITISPEDALPKYICSECLESLKEAIKFKINCELSDKRFRELLNPSGYPTHTSYPYSKHDFQLILQKINAKRLEKQRKADELRKKMERGQQRKDAKTREFKCTFCDIIFPDKAKLSAHKREKNCMRRACDVCGQLVRSIAQHMRHTHKQDMLHRCPTCGKEFPVIARLKSHMLVHTNTFNFFCDLCPYKCKHKYYLVMHMRTHTGEKPYKCPHCPSTFVNPSNLNKHKLTHQEKQFKCMVCAKSFRTGAALRDHHDAAHMNIKHTCAACGRDFCYKSDLRKHEIRNHNRSKRDYIGGEPTYKQLERLQKQMSDNWQNQEVLITQPHQLAQVYVDDSKSYVQLTQAQAQPVYFTDVNMAQPQQPHDLAQPHPIMHMTLADLLAKKDDRLFSSVCTEQRRPTEEQQPIENFFN
ncbi:zinc finger protein 728-like [Aricia agestis]|uniref:zinc finger protein 728-like n=1 Tax=Aricia agestis TaxID=91739 RepID=UPI001C20C431|nr:zinc finger protein 728-like [Aricia agestis]